MISTQFLEPKPEWRNLARLTLRALERRITPAGVHNISNMHLSPTQSAALSLGLNFIPTPKTHHPATLQASLDSLHRDLRLREYFKDVSPDKSDLQKPILQSIPTPFNSIKTTMNLPALSNALQDKMTLRCRIKHPEFDPPYLASPSLQRTSTTPAKNSINISQKRVCLSAHPMLPKLRFTSCAS